jgi:hypothetical protein
MCVALTFAGSNDWKMHKQTTLDLTFLPTMSSSEQLGKLHMKMLSLVETNKNFFFGLKRLKQRSTVNASTN